MIKLASLHRSQSAPVFKQIEPSTFHLISPISEGVGSCYLAESPEKKKCIFKPLSGEPFDIDTALPKKALRDGVLYGETSVKEYAAYMLDHDNFAGVPTTGLSFVQFLNQNPEFGSFQHYQPHLCSTEDMGSSSFSVDQIHRIGVLDLRILNLDRHLGNILVSKNGSGFHLTPIDHGYCLPSFAETRDVSFEWLYWNQCKKPFSISTMNYISKLDPILDMALLHQLGLRYEAVMGNLLATLFLQRGAVAGLTLFTIGNMVQRRGNRKEPSVFEHIVESIIEAVSDMKTSPYQLAAEVVSTVLRDVKSFTRNPASKKSDHLRFQKPQLPTKRLIQSNSKVRKWLEAVNRIMDKFIDEAKDEQISSEQREVRTNQKL